MLKTSDRAEWLNLLEAKFRRQVGDADSQLIVQWLRSASASVEQKGGRYFRQAETLFPDKLRGNILDAGCGDGGVALRFALDGARVVGVDIDPEFVEIAKLRAQEMDCKAVEFQCADLCASDSLSGSYFDLILSIDVIEHVTDAVRYLKGMRQRLKPGGLIWIFTPHRYAMANIMRDPHYRLAGLTLLPNAWAAWYAVRVRRRVRAYEVENLFTARSLGELAGACEMTIAFQSTHDWHSLRDRHAGLKQLTGITPVFDLLFRLYQFRLHTIEAVLAPRA